MTSFTQKWGWPLAACLSVLVAVGFMVKPLWGQPVPGLTISQISSNQIQIQITNGVGSANYEIYRQWELDTNAQWIPYMLGAQGQTNFSTNMGIFTMGFFRAAEGSDWDGDKIPNWLDAQPSSTNAGALTITIDSPTNYATIQ